MTDSAIRTPQSAFRNRLAVLNPKGRDCFRDFSNGPGNPSDPGHPPVNYHAYAACTRGVFCRKIDEIPEDCGLVLLLLRRRLYPAMVALQRLKKSGRQVLVSFKESGSHQVAELLRASGNIGLLQCIAKLADGFLASTPELISVYQNLGFGKGCYLPTPYPLEFEQWDFSVPIERRAGIFVGTREFSVPSRNHAAALLMACDAAKKSGTSVTVLENGERGARRRYQDLQQLYSQLNVVRGPLRYDAYLQLMAKHRLVLQLDHSQVPGQVAGDAALCRTLCLGGDGAIDREIFSHWNDAVRSRDLLQSQVEKLLINDDQYQSACSESMQLGNQRISFFVVAERLLQKFFSPFS